MIKKKIKKWYPTKEIEKEKEAKLFWKKVHEGLKKLGD